MFEVFEFIFSSVGSIIKFLFTIDLGFISLGGLMCCLFIIFPILIRMVNVFKDSAAGPMMEDYRAAKYVSFREKVREREK